MKNLILSLITIAMLTTLSCSSCKKETVIDPNGLPPTTQTGANTLGFVLNGQPWKPAGHFGSTSNLSIDYDPGFKNGIFSIAAYRLTSGGDISYFGIGISDSLNFAVIPATYQLTNNSLAAMSYVKDSCFITYFDNNAYKSGLLTITKLDKTNRIISGTFSGILFKKDCSDTLKFTDGRFDFKF